MSNLVPRYIVFSVLINLVEMFRNLSQTKLGEFQQQRNEDCVCRMCKYGVNPFFPAIGFDGKCEVQVIDPKEHEFVPDFVCENLSSIVGGFDTDSVKNVKDLEEWRVLDRRSGGGWWIRTPCTLPPEELV